MLGKLPGKPKQMTILPTIHLGKLILQAADTWDETWAPNVAVTPIAHRTRSKATVLERQLSQTHLETPTKSTGILLNDSDSEEELDDTESPLAPISPGLEEIQNLIYRQTKDEQIVNTALVSFLSALTSHFALGYPITGPCIESHLRLISHVLPLKLAQTDTSKTQSLVERSGHLLKLRQLSS
ncbi:hypothetical protein ACJ73_04831 [Blastomyces percursus]|uniref:Uncharacterized protein n=1 Tax=Blastomyces percursus TaxID=1658174 RepID=A0A1J9Q6X5_9EURO|nr:hypothetical protein ACJ73_04831 [Blastomyces percursus]